MRKLILIIFMLAIGATGCVGFGANSSGMDDLPTVRNGLTEAGNPDDEMESAKRIYVNGEFDITIAYPLSWDVAERGTEEAEFSSDEGESVTASFIWLEEGESFEDFMIDVRGDTDGLTFSSNDDFDAILCADEDADASEMIIIDCYYYRSSTEEGDAAMVLSGYILPETGANAISVVPTHGDKFSNIMIPVEGTDEEQPQFGDASAPHNMGAVKPQLHVTKRKMLIRADAQWDTSYLDNVRHKNLSDPYKMFD